MRATQTAYKLQVSNNVPAIGCEKRLKPFFYANKSCSLIFFYKTCRWRASKEEVNFFFSVMPYVGGTESRKWIVLEKVLQQEEGRVAFTPPQGLCRN
jgi:hypothetical protein